MSINGNTIDGVSIGGAAALDEEAYQLWLRDTSSAIAHLVEVDYHDIEISGLVTRTLKSADRSDLSFTGYPDRVKSINSFSRQIGDRFTGVVSASIGEIEFSNAEGRLDQWHRLAIDGQRVRVLHGHPSWPYERFRLCYECVADRFSASDEKSLKLQVRGIDYKANLPIQTNLIPNSGANGGANLPVPLLYGDCFNVEPACLDVVNQVYQVHDGAISSVSQVRDGGIPFQTSQIEISAVVGNLISTASAHGFVAGTRVRSDIATLPDSGSLSYKAIAWNGSIFCALISASATYATSPDGVNWTARTLPISKGWSAIKWNGSKFLAIGEDTALTSPDGINWTQQTLPALPGSASWIAAAWNGTVFCIVASGTSNNICATSPDGVVWTTGTLPSSGSWKTITSNGSNFVAIKEASTGAGISADGLNWTATTMPGTPYWIDVVWTGLLYCAIAAASSMAATSPDGVTWTARTMPSVSSWNSIAWNGATLCAIEWAPFSGSNVAATSTDGVAWTARTLPATSTWAAIIWNGAVFCVLGASSYATLSADGIAWTAVSGSLPAPLSLSTDYWVIPDGLTTTDFKLSATRGGTEIALTIPTTGGALIGYHWTSDLTTGKIYLDQKPAGTLTCDAVGTSTDASTIVVAALAAINVDPASQARFQAICDQRMGIYVKERRNRLDVAADIIGGIGAWYGYGRDGMLRFGRVEASPSNYDFALIEDDIKAGTVKIEKIIPPEKKHRLSYRKNWTNQSGKLFAGVSADSRVLYSNDYSASPVQPQATISGDSANAFHALAVVPDVQETMMALAADAAAEAARLDTLYYDWCAIFSLEAKRIATQFDIGHVINVNYPRFGLGDGATEGGGTNMTVVYVEDQPSADKVILKLFVHYTAYTPGPL